MERFGHSKKTDRKKPKKKKKTQEISKGLTYEEVIKRYEELSAR